MIDILALFRTAYYDDCSSTDNIAVPAGKEA